MKLEYNSNKDQTKPAAVLELELSEISNIFLSIANREKRNQTDLYQQKHKAGIQKTSDRKKYLSDLNITIPEHFKINYNIKDIFKENANFLAIGVGDCTANLFRPSFDLSEKDPLFFLKDEPLAEKEYHAFIVQGKDRNLNARIDKINFLNGTPIIKGEKISSLKWLFCSVPLIINSKVVDELNIAINDYDLRHIFGVTEKDIINKTYSQFLAGYGNYISAIKKNLLKKKAGDKRALWYHAGIGIKGDKIIVVHNAGTLMDLANVFYNMKVENAVLLDSGGSSIIWNNCNKIGAVSHNFNYRPKRGAIIICKLK